MKEINLTQNKVALIDNEDYQRINQHKWYAHYQHGYWYAVRNIRNSNGKRITQHMHRFIIDVPDGLETDHINHNGLDNRKCNLRSCTRMENQQNQRLQQKTSSCYKGIHWHKRDKKWYARIRLNGKLIHIGLYTNEIIAALAYNIKATELFGEFACLNFR